MTLRVTRKYIICNVNGHCSRVKKFANVVAHSEMSYIKANLYKQMILAAQKIGS